jgi:hypothetical protein
MEMWSYQNKRFYDRKGRRWHFMFHHVWLRGTAVQDQPYALYFRNDERTAFGVLRFEHVKDCPYRNFDTVIRKIMDNDEFRATLLDEESKSVWRRR